MTSVNSDIIGPRSMSLYDITDISHDLDHDIDHDIDYDIAHDIDHDIIANSPAMSDGETHSFRYEIMKDFSVSIPSCTGELG
jgi:hypothetical protein